MGLLDGRVCLITGASRGIGAATVKRFVEEGAVVYANIRRPKNLDAYFKELNAHSPGTAESVYFDVREETAAKQAVMKIQKERGRLDVLVNNAGVMRDALIGMVSSSLMKEMYDTNVVGGGYYAAACRKTYEKAEKREHH